MFQNISNVNTGNGDFKIIFISSTTNGEVKNNTIGASGGNNIVSDKDGDIWGIHKYGLGGVFTCEGNIIQGFEARSSSASLSNLYLIDVDQGVANVVNNQILNCSSNSQITSSNAIEGIRVSSASTGHLIEGNVISGLNLSSLVANGSDAAGIVITEGSGKIESNYIHDILLGRASSGGSMLRGIYYSGTDDWEMYNNVVWLKNNNGVGGFQYRAVSLDGTGSVKFYHNTLKLESSPDLYIGQCLDIDANGGFDVKNNVFQNLATGTSNPGYTKTITALSEYSSPTFENNYHECPNTLNNMIRWGSTYYDVASWSTYQSISGSFEGNEVVDNEGYASGTQFSGKGADLTTDVPEDKEGISRTTTPWVGAYEGTAPCEDLLVNKNTDTGICGDLRFAITFANTNPGPDTIHFEVASMGSSIIGITTLLPTITGEGTVIIGDGDADGVPDVSIDGGALLGSEDGVVIQASNVVVSGLSVVNFPAHGIETSGAANMNIKILGNYVGVNLDGVTVAGNGATGIDISTDNTYVGDGSVFGGNIVSGNGFTGSSTDNSGVEINSSNAYVYGNYIGTDVSGTLPIANANRGIWVRPSGDGVFIGDNVTNYRNVISANTIGVGVNGVNILLKGNYIGVQMDGVSPLGNSGDAIVIGGGSAVDNRIELNVISNNNRPISITSTRFHQLYKANSIYNNTLGINHSAGSQEGVLPPVIDSVRIIGADTLLFGSSTQGALVQVYLDANNQGEVFVDSVDASVLGVWNVNLNGIGVEVSNGLNFFTATQDSSGNTSAFSLPFGKTLPDTLILTPFEADTLCSYFAGYQVNVNAYGSYGAGNHFIVQLSDPLGDFTTPTNLDTLSSDNPIFPMLINVDMSNVIVSGSAYRVRVVSTLPAKVSNDNGDDMVIHASENITWTGAIDTDWFNCDNWDKGRVPGVSASVLVPSTANEPLIQGREAFVYEITIDVDNGANVNINSDGGGVLNISKP